MSSVAALEAHLRSQPEDWASWLVYGDHLTGQGDVRGELIRLEHQHARTQQGDAEVRAFITQHLPAWSTLAPKGNTVRLQWEHGFIVGLELGFTDELAASLTSFLSSPESRLLRTLAITGLGDPEEGDLEDEELDEEYDEDHPPERYDPELIKAALVALLGNDLSRLTTLSFAYLGMQPAGAKVLAKATGLDALRQLDLRHGALGDAGLEALAHAKFLPQLEALHLQANQLTSGGIKTLAALELPHLSLLDLRWNALGTAGAKALAASKLVSRLTRLRLQRADVGEAGVKALAQSPHLPSPLRTLWKGLHAAPPPEEPTDDED